MRSAKLFGLVAIVASNACSSSSTSTPAGPTADEVATNLANTYCTKGDGCSPLFSQFSFVDVATCKERMKKSFLNALAAPSTGQTPEAMAACNTAAASLSCADLFNGIVPDACKPVAGKLADGAACGDDSQCTSKWCSAGELLDCGKCGTAPAEGGDCTTGGKCAPGAKCQNNKCVTPAKSGESCSADKPCQAFAGLACNDGKCGPAAASGAACNMDGVGKPGCDLYAGNFCIPDTVTSKDGKCQPITWGKVGDKCGVDLGPPIKLTACGGAGTCKEKPAPSVCIGPAKDGEACSTDDKVGPKCIGPSKCANSKCVFPDPATCK